MLEKAYSGPHEAPRSVLDITCCPQASSTGFQTRNSHLGSYEPYVATSKQDSNFTYSRNFARELNLQSPSPKTTAFITDKEFRADNHEPQHPNRKWHHNDSLSTKRKTEGGKKKVTETGTSCIIVERPGQVSHEANSARTSNWRSGHPTHYYLQYLLLHFNRKEKLPEYERQYFYSEQTLKKPEPAKP